MSKKLNKERGTRHNTTKVCDLEDCYGQKPECKYRTPREQFESVFGSVTDDQWQWLKEFLDRQHICRPLHNVLGVRTNDGRMYHPDDIELILKY